MNKELKTKLSFHPLTLDRWKDFEELFGEKGSMCGMLVYVLAYDKKRIR